MIWLLRHACPWSDLCPWCAPLTLAKVSFFHVSPSSCPWVFAHAVPSAWNAFSTHFCFLNTYSSFKGPNSTPSLKPALSNWSYLFPNGNAIPEKTRALNCGIQATRQETSAFKTSDITPAAAAAVGPFTYLTQDLTTPQVGLRGKFLPKFTWPVTGGTEMQTRAHETPRHGTRNRAE